MLTENPVTDEIDRFDEEMAGAHRRVEDFQIEEIVDDVGEVASDLGRIVGIQSLAFEGLSCA